MSPNRRDDHEHGFRLFAESVKDYAIFMLDVDGYVETWNTGAERIKGYEAAEIIGRHFSVFYPPEDIAAGKPQRALETAVREGRYEEEGWRMRKDGSRFWASVVITAVENEEGRLIGFGKVTRDVTERRELLEAEHWARLAAEDANRGKDEFLATVSHELRTPLNVILGEIWRLRNGRLDEESASRAWAALERNARLQLRLVEDLLDSARISSGKLKIEARPVDLARTADQALDMMRAAAERKSRHRTPPGPADGHDRW